MLIGSSAPSVAHLAQEVGQLRLVSLVDLLLLLPNEWPVRKAPSSLLTMAVSPGTIALVACSLLQSLGIG